MGRMLVLDDDILRQQMFAEVLVGHIVIQTSTAKSTIKYLQDEDFDYLFLDHDLGGKQMVPSGPGTGYEVAQWLAAHLERQPKNIVIHSFNSVGAKNMANLLPSALICPGAWSKITNNVV
jgi:CheY-like chemotaxis protein